MKLKISRIETIILLFFMVITMVSCFPSAVDLEADERAAIDKYFQDNPDLQFVSEPSGLYYREVLAGTGVTPVKNDTIYIFYTAKFLNGKKVESNEGTTDTLKAAFKVGKLIPGLDEGLSYMKAGGKATFLIPSKLAYGAAGNYYSVPGYTALLFDVNLVKVMQMTGKK